jgi:hypothetical protein
VEPVAWPGAGAAPYNNVIGIDPRLVDPENGDFRLAAGSPAVGYGCQSLTGGERAGGAGADEVARRRRRIRRDVIDVSGVISANTTWAADRVRVVGDVTVADGVTLTIVPGVRVEFQDFYRLAVAGCLLAVGTPAERIVFTTDEPEQFTIDTAQTGCWNGIRFEETPATNAPSQLAHCVIEYSKAVGTGGGLYPYGGGAISVVDVSQLTIENCVLRHNVAPYGGAMFLYRHANVAIAGNVIVDNHALENASAIYVAYAHPRIANNTIARNTIHNLANPYIESCAVLNFIAKPTFVNNVIRDNDPETTYLHGQLWKNKAYYTRCNNIQDHPTINGNIDLDPLFVSPLGVDGRAGTFDDNWRLLAVSPSVDTGGNGLVPSGLVVDVDGAVRVIDGDGDGAAVVDMGAFESGDCDGDGVWDVQQIASGQAADCNTNLIPDACEIGVHGTSLDCNANALPDECETIAPGDFNGDGGVDAADLLVMAEAMRGPGMSPALTDPRCLGLVLTAFDVDGDEDVDVADFAGVISE